MKILNFTAKVFPGWINQISQNIPDPRIKSRCTYSIEQVFFSGLMIFLLRYRSLRSFCLEHRGNPNSIKNLKQHISISDIPSDDELRYCLQTVPTKNLNMLLKNFHQRLDRSKIFTKQRLFKKHELISLDGTGQLDSANIYCESCLKREHANGENHYYHGQLLASLTNVDADYALPLQFEPIEKGDTDTSYSKNDCELNAAKRLLPKIQSQFPKRNFCFLGDNLFAVEPIILLIQKLQGHFIFTAKEERNKEVFLMFGYLHEQQKKLTRIDQDGSIHEYSWANKLPLKQYHNYKSETPIPVNLICYQHKSSSGELIYKSAWITDFQVTQDNVQILVKAARARFVIENRNFNEQKNLGFQTEHNFGHKGNLPNVFFALAQIAQLISELFSLWKQGKEDIEIIGSKRRYFEKLAVVISEILLPNDESILYLKFNFNSS